MELDEDPRLFFCLLLISGAMFFDDDNNNNNNNENENDDHFGVEYNATVYDGRENSVAAFHLFRLSSSPSFANVAASIADSLA